MLCSKGPEHMISSNACYSSSVKITKVFWMRKQCRLCQRVHVVENICKKSFTQSVSDCVFNILHPVCWKSSFWFLVNADKGNTLTMLFTFKSVHSICKSKRLWWRCGFMGNYCTSLSFKTCVGDRNSNRNVNRQCAKRWGNDSQEWKIS